jgi:hypothetical protein
MGAVIRCSTGYGPGFGARLPPQAAAPSVVELFLRTSREVEVTLLSLYAGYRSRPA